MDGPWHYRQAEQCIREADKVMDADTGMYAHMSGEERIARRTAEFLGAIAHGLAALTAATALADGGAEATGGMPTEDYQAWHQATGSHGRYDRG